MSKALPRTSRLLVVLALGAGACGGGGKSSSYPDASAPGSGGNTGAAGGAVGTATGGKAATASGGSGGMIVVPGSGGTTTPAGGASGTTGTPPAAGSTLLLGGTAILMGPGNTCSSVPATTTPVPDQWCGVFAPSGNNNIGLLVFNLTKALAGTPVCTGTGDPNCLPLTAAIDTQDGNAVYSFFGQTLIYSDASTVYAWRPGWTAGRALTSHSSTKSVSCEGNSNDVAAAICLTDANQIFAGSIATQTGAALPLIDTVTNGSSGIGFSPDGLSLIWSSATAPNAPAETLMTEAFADATTKKTIANDITNWTISADFARWYWLSAPIVDASQHPNGTLQTAPFPAGTAPVTIQASVAQFATFGAKSAITLTPAGAKTTAYDLDVVADVDNGATTTTVLEAGDVAQALALTDTGTVLYATTVVQPSTTSSNSLYDLRVAKADGTGKCTVDATATADVSASFNQAGTAVEWVQVTLDTTGKATAITGQFTTLADCAPHVFSTGLLYNLFDVTTGLLVQQNFDSNAYTADVDYAAIDATGVPAASVLVQAKADAVIAPLFPSPGRILFTLNSGSDTDGVYLSRVITGAVPQTAPAQRPLAPALLAKARFASLNRSIPSSIAAPARLSLPRAAGPGSSFSAPGALKTRRLAPLSRSSSVR